MTLQLYYQLQAKLQALETFASQFMTGLEEAREIFNQIDPNQLGGVVTGQPPATSQYAPAAPPTTGAATPPPKQRSKLNSPVLTGPLKDVVEDMLSQKRAEADAAAAPKRIAPYEVEVTNVGIGAGGEFWATVFDRKNNEEAMVPTQQSMYDEFQKDPVGLVLELGPETLAKTEWLPLQAITQDATLQDVINSGGPEAAAVAQAAANNLGVDPSQVVFTDPNEED
jgi:hypothetical protein